MGMHWMASPEAVPKIGFWFKIKAGSGFNPQAYKQYAEDLKPDPNAEIGPKDFFDTASVRRAGTGR
jgi:hypothetical protein